MTDMASLVAGNLDIWTCAIERKPAAGRGKSKKFSLYGIEKLRGLILDLAVRGMLVPQDTSEEPASELLKRIKIEKENLIAEGKIKKPKPFPKTETDEKPFPLPDGWIWTRLANITSLITKGSSPKWQGVDYTDDENDVLFITSENVGKYRLLMEKRKYVEKVFNKVEPRSILQQNDFLMNIVGASIGRTAIFNLVENCNINQAVCLIRTIEDHLNLSFLLHFFNSDTCLSYMFDKQVDNARANLSMGNISKFVIPLPPLAEQRRIVAKVDELMALCDMLEEGAYGAIEAHEVLVKTLLATLTNSKDAQDLATNWTRLETHFDTLFTTEASIDQLKQTILQLAVMGKLVPQNPDDEPASELLIRIKTEKEQLITEGKIKKSKLLPQIKNEEKLFGLPNGWEWCRVGDVGITFTGGTPKTSKPEFFSGAIPFIGPGQITSEGEIVDAQKFLTEAGILESTEALPNDIMMVCIGGSIGKSALVLERAAFNQQINLVRPMILLSEYIISALRNELFQNAVLIAATGTATPIINRSKWERLVISISPLAEQQRIVAKVDELMDLCDNLKSRIKDSACLQKQLADTIVAQAVA